MVLCCVRAGPHEGLTLSHSFLLGVAADFHGCTPCSWDRSALCSFLGLDQWFCGGKSQWHISPRTWWASVEVCQWLRVSHPKSKEVESRSLLFLLSHWTWTSLCYFILMAPLLSCGPHKVLLSLPYSHCLQDSRGFFSWLNFVQPGQIKGIFSFSNKFKVTDLCRRKIKISSSFQEIDLKSFHFNHSEWMIPC